MKLRTIEKTLNGLMKKWVKSIEDKNVQKLVQENTIITGGAIASMLLREKVNDYDIYFRNRETQLAVVKYYTKDIFGSHDKIILLCNNEEVDEKVYLEKGDRLKVYIKSVGIMEMKPKKDKKYTPIFVTANAITLSDKVQLITRFCGEPKEIHSNYDFQHTKSWYDSKTGRVTVPPHTWEALMTKELKYTGSKYPLSSIIRTRKFIARGWTITAGAFLKMAIQLNQLDLMNIDVLEDQLIGVDTTYFKMFIDDVRAKMKEARDKGTEFKLTSSYVIETIDRIFHYNQEELPSWDTESEEENNDDDLPW